MPRNLKDFEIPEVYTHLDSEQFLLGHYEGQGETVIVFSTTENLKLLHQSPIWIIDGTFKCCPGLLHQLYSIHGRVGHNEAANRVLPLAYGMLSNKTENSYRIFFEIIKTNAMNKLSIHLNPEIIMSDFEFAAIKASTRVFPQSQHKCCYFHLRQNIWKRVQAIGLAKKYIDDSRFAHEIRHLAALAFLEPREVPAAFEMIQEEVLSAEAASVAEWFYKYYVGGIVKTIKKSDTQISNKKNYRPGSHLSFGRY